MPNPYKWLVDFFTLDEPAPPVEKSESPVIQKSDPHNWDLSGVYGGKLYTYWLGEGDKAYGTNYIVHRCVSLLASNLSKIPLRVYRGDKAMPPDLVLTDNGVTLDLRNPHPRMSLSSLLYQCGVYYWYKGEFMALIDEKDPFSLEPINPSRMKIEKASGSMIDSWKLDKNIHVPSERLVYANVFNPDIEKISDSNRTLSPVMVVKAELKNYLSGREFNTQFFKNFAQVGLTLRDIEANTTREEREAIVQELDNTVKAGNAWRTKCLPQGLDIADTKNTTLKEMQLNEMFKDLRDIILGIYGVPRSVFGITNEAGLAQNTVDAEKRIMWTDTIQPVGFLIQEAINQTLMKRYFPGYTVKFDYSDVKVLQEDMAEKAKMAKIYRELSYTTNEVDELFGLGIGRVEDPAMNTRYVPINIETYDNAVLSPDLPLERPTDPENDDKSAEFAEILEKIEQEAARKDPPGLRKKYVSRLRGHYSKQLGSVLGTVKNDDFSNKTTLLNTILTFLMEDKEKIKEIIQPFYQELQKYKEREITGEEIKRVTGINNYVYFGIKKSVLSADDAENAAKNIIVLYKKLAPRYKKILKHELSAWMEEE